MRATPRCWCQRWWRTLLCLWKIATSPSRPTRASYHADGEPRSIHERLRHLLEDQRVPPTTLLHLLALQDKMQLWNHLQVALVKELEVEGAGKEARGSWAYGVQGGGSSRAIAPVRYTAPRAIYILGELWLLRAREFGKCGPKVLHWMLDGISFNFTYWGLLTFSKVTFWYII